MKKTIIIDRVVMNVINKLGSVSDKMKFWDIIPQVLNCWKLKSKIQPEVLLLLKII